MGLTRDKVFWDSFTGHADRSVRAARLLREMLEKLPPEDSPEAGKASVVDRASHETLQATVSALAEKISELESEGDKITHECLLALHQTWITPLDREEIHALISKLDDVLDYIEAAAERVALYELDIVTPEALDLARVLEASAMEVARAVAALPNVREADALLQLCVAINRHENEADALLRRGLARLFKEARDPLYVMKWRDVYESLETATDRAEDVANIIEGIVLEHA